MEFQNQSQGKIDPIPGMESADFKAEGSMDFQSQVVAKGREIFEGMEEHNQSIFNKDWWYGRIMEWSMKNEQFKTQMFRFVDVLPYLTSGSEVSRHLKEYFSEGDGELPSIFNFGMGMGALAPNLVAKAVRKNVSQMAKMFIAGEDAKEALPKLENARKKNLCFTVDLLGEVTLSEEEAKSYYSKYLELINDLSERASKWQSRPQIDTDSKAEIPKVNVSVKITSLYSQIKSEAWEQSKSAIKERLRPIFRLAKESGVFINIDMEHYGVKDLTLEVFEEIILEPEFKDYPHWGIVLQAYLRDSYKDAETLVRLAKTRGTPFTVRLVKGAYWDAETIEAEQERWPIPVYTEKKESDANYERCTQLLLDNYPHIRLAIGSHNVRSVAAAIVYAVSKNIPKEDIEFQMLFGMADPIKTSLINMGFRVREYVPVGELIPGMAYLVRRLLENTSNESFLRSKFAENVSIETLLKDPAENLKISDGQWHDDGKFHNEPLLDFALPEPRQKMQTAIEGLRQKCPRHYQVVIDNTSISTEKQIEIKNPSRIEETLGSVNMAGTEEAERAVQSSKKAFASWADTDVEKRAQLVEKLADLILTNRYELAALQTLEVGKPWSEADGDITEAIDFCRFYARHMRKIDKGHWIGGVPGETTQYLYRPRGIVGVIAPWNFPLAILTGMVSSAIVSGNTVVMKPAEQSLLTAARLMTLIQEAGFPDGVVNFLPGYGEEVGEYLVNHPDVQMISFTGSKEVGLKIIEKTSKFIPGQRAVKKCVIEMGGKNAIIVDSDADLDEAVAGVVYSAFGFSGQKCSACSRVIVLESIYDKFIDRLVKATESIKQGEASDPSSYLGPVIDNEAYERIMTAIEEAKKEADLAYQGELVSGGHFVPPTVFTNVSPDSMLAQTELFGPVLAVIKAKDLDEAITIANNTIYGLTGGIYSRSPANIERARKEIEVGNLYINRGVTGALVDRHPFGGLKMSGVGSKTGGPDYLFQFVEPYCVTENTMRRGFAPDDGSKTYFEV